jgi:hypothetical protein
MAVLPLRGMCFFIQIKMQNSCVKRFTSVSLRLAFIPFSIYNVVMKFIPGSIAGCTTPATLAPVAACPRVAWVIRKRAVSGLVVICPTAAAVAPVLAFLRACNTTFWFRVRSVVLASGVRAWVIRVGVRSAFVSHGSTVAGVLRLAAPRLSSAVLSGAA